MGYIGTERKKDDIIQWIRLRRKETERNYMNKNVHVFIWNMTGYGESDQDGLEYNIMQHENTLWIVIGVNE